MGNVLYVTNFPPEATADDLFDLFDEHGAVTSVEIDVEERIDVLYAIAEMSSEKHATKAHRNLNGYAMDEVHRLAVSYPELEPRDLTTKQRKALEEIAIALDETDDVPLRQIETMARLCGLFFVEALVDEALDIDAGEGLLTSDAERRRTKGGVFFYLARYRMSPTVRRVIFNRKGRLPADLED